MHPDLASASHAFVRVDHAKPPLTPAYTGPYKILTRGEKTVTLDFKGRRETISLDRVKPAHTETIIAPVRLPDPPFPRSPQRRHAFPRPHVSWNSPLVTTRV